MSMIQSHYEINVSRNGSHFFATDERSCVTERQTAAVYAVLAAKFPTSEGYKLEVTRINCGVTVVEMDHYNSVTEHLPKPVPAPTVPKAVTEATGALLKKFVATPGETKRRLAHDRAEVGKMSDILNADGFSLRPDLEGAGGSYSVWQRQCGTPVAIEVRLFNNCFFRVISFEGFELATGVGIIQLRSALRSQAVR